MRNILVKNWLASGLILAALAGSVNAEADQNLGLNPDPVYVFNRICYAQVPNVQSIQTMSTKLAWRAIEAAELKEFKNSENPTFLAGWDVQVGERLFRVGVTQSVAGGTLLAAFPEFLGGITTSCSVVLDDQQDAAMMLENMQTLVGKEPISSGVREGFFRTTTWGGGNADLKVFAFAKVPVVGEGGLLNVTILQKQP